MKLARHLTLTGKKKDAYNVLVGKPAEKGTLGRSNISIV
jgi:hypothetical protein